MGSKNKLTDSVREFDLKKLSKKNALLIACAVVALIMLLVLEGSSSKKETDECDVKTGVSSSEYIKTQEEKLEKLLENIDGAGKVRVMLTLESCYENVYLKESALKSESDDTESKSETEEKYITVKTGSNEETGVIIKVYEPVVKGVAVVAEGAGSDETKMAIIETVSAVFNINSANISVEKMKPERKE